MLGYLMPLVEKNIDNRNSFCIIDLVSLLKIKKLKF